MLHSARIVLPKPHVTLLMPRFIFRLVVAVVRRFGPMINGANFWARERPPSGLRRLKLMDGNEE